MYTILSQVQGFSYSCVINGVEISAAKNSEGDSPICLISPDMVHYSAIQSSIEKSYQKNKLLLTD